MESMWGSSSYLAIILMLTIITNISFILVCVLLYMFGMAQALFFECTGFWVVLFSLLTIESMQAPDMPRRMMFIPMDIPSKYFPLIMYGLFCLFSGPILSYAVALAVGYVYSQGYLERLRPTSYYLEGLESPGGMLHTLSRSRGWILSGAAIGHDAWIALNSTPAGGQGASWAQQGQQQGQGQGQGQGQQSRGFGGFGGLGSDQGHGSGSGAGQEKPSAVSTSTGLIVETSP
jgi:hypothetical protein